MATTLRATIDTSAMAGGGHHRGHGHGKDGGENHHGFLREELPVKIVRRWSELKQARQMFEPVWRECFGYTFPERGQGFDGMPFDALSAQAGKNRILDDTAGEASRTLAASIVSGTTPANSLWFGLDSDGGGADGNGTDAEKHWLDLAARLIFENIHQSNFDSVAFECVTDLVPAGWFVLFIGEETGGGFRFEQWPVCQCCVSSSRVGGVVDTIFRRYEMSVEQMIREFGFDGVSERVRALFASGKYGEKQWIIHGIFPRELSAGNPSRNSKRLPFASVYVEESGKHLMRESGFFEFPCVVPRWMMIPGSAYAVGPISVALGSIRTVNDVKRLEFANLDMAVAGMWIAEDDGVLNPRALKVGARQIVVANSVDSVKPLTPGVNFEVAFVSEERLQGAIRRALLADQLQPQNGPNMTAYEVSVRVGLIRQMLGPIFGRLQAEYLQPLVEICFGIAYRAGVLGVAPESLIGQNFSVKYIGPLARAQKLEDVNAIDRYFAAAVQGAQVIGADALDTIDFDAAQRIRADALGVPMSVIPDEKTIAARREARRQQEQAQAQQAMQAEMLKSAAPQIAQGMMAQ
jgi:hypothetical protein